MRVCICGESKVDVLCETHGDPMTISQAEYLRLVRIENAAKTAISGPSANESPKDARP